MLHEIDRILEPDGGFPAVGRDRQESNYIVSEEMEQLRTWATVVPLIFLSVSAFLVNVVLSRLVSLQRPEIATLKALGYSRLGDRPAFPQAGLHRGPHRRPSWDWRWVQCSAVA